MRWKPNGAATAATAASGTATIAASGAAEAAAADEMSSAERQLADQAASGLGAAEAAGGAGGGAAEGELAGVPYDAEGSPSDELSGIEASQRDLSELVRRLSDPLWPDLPAPSDGPADATSNAPTAGAELAATFQPDRAEVPKAAAPPLPPPPAPAAPVVIDYERHICEEPEEEGNECTWMPLLTRCAIHAHASSIYPLHNGRAMYAHASISPLTTRSTEASPCTAHLTPPAPPCRSNVPCICKGMWRAYAGGKGRTRLGLSPRARARAALQRVLEEEPDAMVRDVYEICSSGGWYVRGTVARCRLCSHGGCSVIIA